MIHCDVTFGETAVNTIHGNAFHIFYADNLVSDNPMGVINAMTGHLDSLSAAVDKQLLEHMRKEILECIDGGEQFLPVIDITSFPVIKIQVNKDSKPAKDDDFGRECTKAYKANLEHGHFDSDLKGLKYVVVNLKTYTTHLKEVEYKEEKTK